MSGRESPYVLLAGADVERLQRFRAAHPRVIIGDGGFGTLQALIPEENGETIRTAYTLGELLDKLDSLFAEAERDPAGETGLSRPSGG